MTELTVVPASESLSADGDNEFLCPECGRRCTRGNSGTEYGHERGRRNGYERCPHRPDTVDPAGQR